MIELFSLATKVLTNLKDAPQQDVDELKRRLGAYGICDGIAPLVLLKPLRAEQHTICFGANDSGLGGPDFWLMTYC